MTTDCIKDTDFHTWEETLDKTTQDLIDFDLKTATGARAYEDMLKEFFETKILKESDERYRCELCGKMFKARVFVEKHIQNKHPDNVKEIEVNATDEQFYRNYLTHGQRILPSSQYVFVDDEVKEEPKPERKGSPEWSPRAEDDQNSDSRRDRDRSRDRSTNRRHSQPNQRGGRRVRGSGPRRFSQEGVDRPDLPPPPEYRDKQDPRAIKVYTDLDSNLSNKDNFDFDFDQALAAFAAGGDPTKVVTTNGF